MWQTTSTGWGRRAATDTAGMAGTAGTGMEEEAGAATLAAAAAVRRGTTTK